MNKLSDICEDRRLSRPQNNAARERSRVKTLRTAFLDLQKSLPAVPPNTKLSKLDILVLATAYIYHLTRTLENHDPSETSMQQDIQALEYSQRLAVSEGWGERGHERVPQESSWLARMSSLDVSNPLMSPALSLSAVTSQIFTTNGHQLQKQAKSAERFSLSSFRPTCHDKTLQTSSSRSDYDLSVRPNRCLHKEYGPHDDNVFHWQQFKNDKQCKQRVMSKSHPSRRGAVGILHPVKKWPMRSRLYDSILGCKTQSQLLSSDTHDVSQPNSQ